VPRNGGGETNRCMTGGVVASGVWDKPRGAIKLERKSGRISQTKSRGAQAGDEVREGGGRRRSLKEHPATRRRITKGKNQRVCNLGNGKKDRRVIMQGKEWQQGGHCGQKRNSGPEGAEKEKHKNQVELEGTGGTLRGCASWTDSGSHAHHGWTKQLTTRPGRTDSMNYDSRKNKNGKRGGGGGEESREKNIKRRGRSAETGGEAGRNVALGKA